MENSLLRNDLSTINQEINKIRIAIDEPNDGIEELGYTIDQYWPTESIEITENGEYDVTNCANANIAIPVDDDVFQYENHIAYADGNGEDGPDPNVYKYWVDTTLTPAEAPLKYAFDYKSTLYIKTLDNATDYMTYDCNAYNFNSIGVGMARTSKYCFSRFSNFNTYDTFTIYKIVGKNHYSLSDKITINYTNTDVFPNLYQNTKTRIYQFDYLDEIYAVYATDSSAFRIVKITIDETTGDVTSTVIDDVSAGIAAFYSTSYVSSLYIMGEHTYYVVLRYSSSCSAMVIVKQYNSWAFAPLGSFSGTSNDFVTMLNNRYIMTSNSNGGILLFDKESNYGRIEETEIGVIDIKNKINNRAIQYLVDMNGYVMIGNYDTNLGGSAISIYKIYIDETQDTLTNKLQVEKLCTLPGGTDTVGKVIMNINDIDFYDVSDNSVTLICGYNPAYGEPGLRVTNKPGYASYLPVLNLSSKEHGWGLKIINANQPLTVLDYHTEENIDSSDCIILCPYLSEASYYPYVFHAKEEGRDIMLSLEYESWLKLQGIHNKEPINIYTSENGEWKWYVESDVISQY